MVYLQRKHVCQDFELWLRVVKALNRLKKRPKIGVIFGWNEAFAPVAGKESKVDFYLKKPFKHSVLVKYINEAFGVNDYLAKPVDIDKLVSLLHVWLHK